VGGKLNLYDVGGGGVNLVKSPLQLADNEATQLQNAEYVRNETTGGTGSLSKRGGLAVLNSSALSGAIRGMLGLNLKTTYTRTLYAARGDEDANTFLTSTNGTTWTDTSTPLVPVNLDFYTTDDGEFSGRRFASFRNSILYPKGSYTIGTDKPSIAIFDGTNALSIYDLPFGPSATASTPASFITDMLVANGKIYFTVKDPGGSAPNLTGRVMSLDIETGIVSQIANSFGGGTGEVTGGFPACISYYQNLLFVGLNHGGTSDGIGKIVRCFPEIDTTWTSDVTNLSGSAVSLAIYRGDLFAGLRSSTATNARVSRRSSTTQTWATSFTSSAGTSGEAQIASLTVFNDELYAIDYFSGSTDVLHIIKFDNSSWTTDRDVDANDSPADPPQLPGGMAILSNKLYVVFAASGSDGTDGFVMQKSGSTWTKVATDNFAGPITTLVTRS
jgi:hypothetical protein